MSRTYDVIVIGVGGMGSAVCYHAGRLGASVLGLEQYQPAHDRGSSHGETRIIRRAYFEHPDYVPLLLRAYELWRDVEQQTGRRLLTSAGLMIAGPAAGEAVSGTRQAAQLHQLPLQDVKADDATKRFPQFQFHNDQDVVFEEAAGYLGVEDCVRAHLDLARRNQVDLRFDSPVVGWTSNGSTVRVRTASEEFEGKSLVIAAGPWASRCVNGWQVPLKVVRKVVAWFPITRQQAAAFRNGPTFFFETAFGQFYGFPSLDGQTIKVAEHTGGADVLSPETVDRRVSDADIEPIARFLKLHIPGAGCAAVKHSVCLYTLTPDHHFVIDRHRDDERVIVACGFSGHGFKFAPVVGEAIAEMAVQGKTNHPIGFLRADRFGKK